MAKAATRRKKPTSKAGAKTRPQTDHAKRDGRDKPKRSTTDAQLEAETQERYEQAKRADLSILDLQEMTQDQLDALVQGLVKQNRIE